MYRLNGAARKMRCNIEGNSGDNGILITSHCHEVAMSD
jgi:hypothetical protein